MNDDTYNNARTIAQTVLRDSLDPSDPNLTRQEIERAVEGALYLLRDNAVDAETLVADLERSFQTLIGTERSLETNDGGYAPWLPTHKASIDWAHWRRYETHLMTLGWDEPTLRRLDESTDRVLGLLTAPDRPGPWDRRGMVVGDVQSGKTSHYTGLIAKAADAGYKLIIVLAGFHKSLRSQTQIRLEEGFVGYDASDAFSRGGGLCPVGVGEIDPNLRPNTVTTRADGGDFKRQLANQLGIQPGGDVPLLLVIKKNGAVLKNLLAWLGSVAKAQDKEENPYLQNIPLLVIDDEADQGSINTNEVAFDEDGQVDEEYNPTTLNRRIRRLLYLFEQSAYVGYTATPFANIFIHESSRSKRYGEDLFPRSFIVSLPTPSHYVGPSRIFGRENAHGELAPGIPITLDVTDHAASLNLHEDEGWIPPRHDKSHTPLFEGMVSLPPSLRLAVRCFILSTAARGARGQKGVHNSMLVHVTRFTNVQAQVVEQIKDELANLKRRLRFQGSAVRGELREIWESEYIFKTRQIAAPDCPMVSWEAVDEILETVIQAIQVRAINGMAGEVLDYVAHREEGLNVIAIGGDKLSRGLTLEGLTVSYFLRASKMYDTLMQMGRWFGFRPGYLDLSRLFSTPDLIEWFGHIAMASEELREDFNRMAASGGTPREFGHRVRCHPLLMVTSRVKMRNGQQIQVTFAGDISETTNFCRDAAIVQKNWSATQRLIGRAESGREKGAKPLWTGVAADTVLEFLTSYEQHEASTKCIPTLLAEYIRSEIANGRLTDWTVKMCSGELDENNLCGYAVKLVKRDWYLGRGITDDEQKRKIRADLESHGQFRIRRLVSPTDEATGLTRDQVKTAQDLTDEDYEAGNTRHKEPPTNPSGQSLRTVRPDTQGLLLIYPLDGTGKVEEEARSIPTIGFAISFPHVDSGKASKVTYTVNNVYYEQELGRGSRPDEALE